MSLIIIGGGITGITLSLAISFLTKGKLKIILIESNDLNSINYDSEKYNFNKHAIALSSGTCQQLINIDIWKFIKQYTRPIKYIHISEHNSFGICLISAKDYNIKSLGSVIELCILKEKLFNYLKTLSNIDIYCPSTVNKILRNKDNVTVFLSTGEILSASLLVMANGSYSDLTFSLGIECKKKYFQQIALVSTINTEISNKYYAFEQFSFQGPLSLLPISDKKLALVWCHHILANKEISNWNKKEFLINLQKTFGWRLGEFIDASERIIYPIKSHFVLQPISHRLVLVGNAAQTLHPIAGQGFNLCFRDVMFLAETLMSAYYKNNDIGSYNILYSYFLRRKIDRELTFNFTQKLLKIFSNKSYFFNFSRNIGLLAIDKLPIIRNIIVEYALGWINK